MSRQIFLILSNYLHIYQINNNFTTKIKEIQLNFKWRWINENKSRKKKRRKAKVYSREHTHFSCEISKIKMSNVYDNHVFFRFLFSSWSFHLCSSHKVWNLKTKQNFLREQKIYYYLYFRARWFQSARARTLIHC